ncbi:MAG TPA: protein kinase [Vicinamibacterales bacterium]|nr:protein kinase [Vicinamibacterales bacterium]
MNEDRWRKIEELYHAARLLNETARSSFLAAATEGDEELRREVESLLASGASSPGFLDEPWQTAVAPAIVSAGSTLSGHRIGTYAIHERIGAGGMGEVYRAYDSTLHRDVALKVLAAELISENDPQRQGHLRRFRREAHALAALNHPNIAAIYGLEEADGLTALVMELVEGSTLADRIAHASIPVEEALPIATQIAEALEAAHAQGIIHRDLKPANIKLRPDGRVKVLDFGLAKHTTASPDDATGSLDPAITKVGAVFGTPAYMAPEQVLGRECDSRTDLFAFGLVLYEMVTSRRPFPGASLGSLLAGGTDAAIDPPCQGRSRIASRLNALILGLLERDPNRRPRSAAVVRRELLELGQPRRVPSATLLAAGAGTLMLTAAALWWFISPGARARPVVSSVALITTYAGDETTPSVSPDGTLLAFSWTGEDGRHRDIYVTRSDGQDEPRQLTRDASPDTMDVFPAWSPDQTQIAFVRRRGATNGDVMVTPAQGGPVRTLREIRFVAFPAFTWLAWTPDSAQIAFASQSLESGRSTLFIMRLADGKVRSLAILPPDGVIGDASPAFSPDGRSLAFVRWSSPSTSTLLVQKLSDGMEALGEPANVPGVGKAPGSAAWVDNKRLLFSEGERVLEWESGVNAEQIYLPGERLAGLAIAGREAGGTLRVVTAQQRAPAPRIWMIPLRAAGLPGGPPEVLSRLGNASDNPDYSPDGKHIVFVSRRSGTPELWMTDGDGGDLKQLTRLGVQSLGVPHWSPDNRHVAFFARMGPEPQIYVIDAAQDQAVPRQATHEVPGCNIPSWSRSGKYLYCSRRIGGEMRLYRIPTESGETGASEMERWFEGKSATETSDGRVLYIKDDRQGLFARSLAGDPPANPEERLVEDIKGPIGYFAPVSAGVYYTGQDSVGRYVALRYFDYARGKTVDIAPKSVTGAVNSLTVSPDGRRLVYTQNSRGGIDLSLIQFQDDRKH